MNFDISVVIPFRGRDKYIHQVLSALDQQLGVKFEVIMVLNPENREWPAMAEHQFPIIKETSARGANHARNQGLARAASDLVLFLDSDCVPQGQDFLNGCISFMKQNPNLTGCGGSYQLESSANKVSQAYHYLQMRWLTEGLLNEEGYCHHLLGGFLVLRKDKLLNQNFDPKMVFGGTEREFLKRLLQQGHRFRFIQNFSVLHAGQLSLLSLIKKAYAQGKGAGYTLEKLGPEENRNVYLKKISTDPKLFFLIEIYRIFFELGHGSKFSNLFLRFWYSVWNQPLSFFKSIAYGQNKKFRKALKISGS